MSVADNRRGIGHATASQLLRTVPAGTHAPRNATGNSCPTVRNSWRVAPTLSLRLPGPFTSYCS